MEEVFQRFFEWFPRFLGVSAVILLATHLAARFIRGRRSKSDSASDQSSNSRISSDKAKSS